LPASFFTQRRRGIDQGKILRGSPLHVQYLSAEFRAEFLTAYPTSLEAYFPQLEVAMSI
jgi:hypothetical protein